MEIASTDSISLAMTRGTASPRNDTIKEEYSDAQPSAATTGVVALQTLHNPGPSSFSVSIEDDKGNIIMVRRLEDMANTSTPTSDIEISEESGRMVLTWQGQGKAKGFILHRAERGKDNYAPVSNLIPYFGQVGRERYLYKFIDNATKPGIQYNYRQNALWRPYFISKTSPFLLILSFPYLLNYIFFLLFSL